MNSSSVRDFIYLDQSKLLSYLSQIHGGLQLLTERVERQFRTEEKADPEYKSSVEAAVEAELLGKVPLFVEGSFGSQYKTGRETTTGGDKTATGRSGQRAVVSTIHHEALEIVQSHLGDKLISVTGDLQIVDFEHFLSFTRNFNDFVTNFNKVTKGNLTKITNLKELHALVSTASAGRVLAFLQDNDSTISTAYLQREHLTADSQSISDNYGIRLSGEYTVIGIDATPNKDKIDFSKLFNQAHEDGHEMGIGLVDTIQKMESMLDFWRLKSRDSHLYPIAIYREL